MNKGYKFYYLSGEEIKTGDVARRLFDHGSLRHTMAGHTAGAEGTVTNDPSGRLELTLRHGHTAPFNPENVELVRRAGTQEDPTRGELVCRAAYALHEALKARNAARETVKTTCYAYNTAVKAYDEAKAAAEQAARNLLKVAGADAMPDSSREFCEDPLPQPRATPSDK